MITQKNKSSGLALIPFLLFIAIYLGVGAYLHAKGVEMAFYQFPVPTACLIGVVAAFLLFKGNMTEKFAVFAKGVGSENIVIMCMIYLLAGGFSAVSNQMGGVDSVVNLGLSLVPAQFATAGLFVIACFMSLATGTSMGTLAAIVPIAMGLVEKTNLNAPLLMAAVVGGAMFGDNLSVISDTTIAATRTQGCDMRDKFRCNLTIALPAAIITFVLLLIFGRPETAAAVDVGPFSIIKVLPYLSVLIFAILGVNVFIVLTGGIVFSGIIGMATGTMSFLGFGVAVYDGMKGMMEVFLTSILIGGLAHMVTHEGGIQWILNKIQHLIRGKKSAEVGIATMVVLSDIAVANNTIAIIVDGPISRSICEKYKVDPRRAASLLDIFSCVVQGVIPYGAQLLILGSLTGGAVAISQLLPLLWYQWLLAIMALLSIFIPFANWSINKDPWNFEKWEPQSKADAQ